VIIGGDDNDGAVHETQAGARHWPYGARRLPGLADEPGSSEDEHLGVCCPVE
jgi:hypothetical protein